MNLRLHLLITAMLFPIHVMANDLVFTNEVDEYQGLLAPAAQSSAPNDFEAPKIMILRPEIERAVRAPFPILISFQTSDGSAPDWSSLRVFYGNLLLDITDRVLRQAVLRADSLYVPEARVPPGSHRLTLQISDKKKSVVQKEFLLLVEK